MANKKPTSPEMVPEFAQKLIKELSAIFNSISDQRKVIVAPLIDNFAFMTGSLYVLQAQIAQDGFTEEYRNGERQSGKKQSAACAAYLSMVKTYPSVIKKLIEEIPDEAAHEELEAFLNAF